MSPFFANHGQDPLWQFDLSEPAHSQEVRDARQLATKFKEITTHLQAEILRAQQYPDQADKRHKPAPAFKVGGPCLTRNSDIYIRHTSTRHSDGHLTLKTIHILLLDILLQVFAPFVQQMALAFYSQLSL